MPKYGFPKRYVYVENVLLIRPVCESYREQQQLAGAEEARLQRTEGLEAMVTIQQ
jgi:hypothetical protein